MKTYVAVTRGKFGRAKVKPNGKLKWLRGTPTLNDKQMQRVLEKDEVRRKALKCLLDVGEAFGAYSAALPGAKVVFDQLNEILSKRAPGQKLCPKCGKYVVMKGVVCQGCGYIE